MLSRKFLLALSPEMDDILKNIAEKKGISKSSLIRMVLTKYIKKLKKKGIINEH